jgi:hypothetical protein
MVICALGFAGCVDAADTADNQTGSVEQHTGGGLFDCQNKASISGVQCVSAPINVDVKNVSALDGNKISILDNDLNNLNIGDINILNGNSILNDLVDVTKNDFLNKFNVTGVDGNVCAQASVLDVLGVVKQLQVCK